MIFIVTLKFNNLAIYHTIEQYLYHLSRIMQQPHHEQAFRSWCQKSMLGIKSSIIKNISCGYAMSMYPYNYDSELDDLDGCNDPKHDDTKTLYDNYVRTYHLVAGLAKDNAKRFSYADTSSVPERIYQTKPELTSRKYQVSKLR